MRTSVILLWLATVETKTHSVYVVVLFTLLWWLVGRLKDKILNEQTLDWGDADTSPNEKINKVLLSGIYLSISGRIMMCIGKTVPI